MSYIDGRKNKYSVQLKAHFPMKFHIQWPHLIQLSFYKFVPETWKVVVATTRNAVAMLSVPLYQSSGCLGTRPLLQSNEVVCHLSGGEYVLLGHLRLPVDWGTAGACSDTRYR
jgi:hypothetical protein